MLHESSGGIAGEIARFGVVSVVVEREAGSSRRHGDPSIYLTGAGPFRVVVQKGRSFQPANPHVPVRVDRGRYLVVELPLSIPLLQESSFTVAAATYTSLETQVSLQSFGSDHLPFVQAGLPAVLTIEGTDSAYEHEHTARDASNRLGYTLHRAITCMHPAWLLERTLPF